MEEEQKEINPKAKSSIVKKLFKILLYIVLAIIGLNVLLYALLSIPYVQQKVADFAVNELKTILKTEVSIDEVRLNLFNKVTLKGIYVEDQAKDTLLYAKSLEASIDPMRLIKSKTIEITGVSLDQFIINVNRKDSISDFNFQFIIDAFSGSDTTRTDTTKSSLAIVIKDIKLSNGCLNYDVMSMPQMFDAPQVFDASHIHLYDFNANVSLYSLDSDLFDIDLSHLSVKEKSGLEIKDIKTRFFSNKSLYWLDGLSLVLPNSHLNISHAQYNLDTGEFGIKTNDTEIFAKDLVPFLPNLKFLDQKISLNTHISGKLPSVEIENIELTYGDKFKLDAKAFLDNVEQYGNSDIYLSIDKLRASANDITSFVRLGDSTFTLPDIVKDLGEIMLKGELKGRLNKFNLDVEAWSRQGAISLLADGGVDTTFSNFDVRAKLETQNFNVGRLLQMDSTGLGRLSTHLDVKAHRSVKVPLSAEVYGAIDALEYGKEVIKRVSFKGHYNAKDMGLSVDADWSIGKISMEANMTQAKIPDVYLRLRTDSLHVDRFYKNESWINPRLTMAVDGQMKGLDIDIMQGFLNIDSVDFHDDNFSIQPKKFSLTLGHDGNNDQFIKLNSSYLTANLTGEYRLTTLADEFTNLMSSYLPDLFQSVEQIKQNANNFKFDITVHNTTELNNIFPLPVNIVLPSTISGRINTIAEKIDIKGDIPYLQQGSLDIRNTSIDISNADSMFHILANSTIKMGEDDYRLSLKSNGANNSIQTIIGINSDSSNVSINGGLETLVHFNKNENNELVSSLKIIPSDINVGKLKLNLSLAQLSNVGNRTTVDDFGLHVDKKKYFGIDGAISDEKTDSLKVYFNHVEIGQLLEAFDVKNIEGCVHGNILLTDILGQPEVYTKDFEIADIIIFGDTLGSLALESSWNNELDAIAFSSNLSKANNKYAEAGGTIYADQDYIDMYLLLDQLPLGWLQPFLTGTLNSISGSISTNLSVEGSMKAPEIRGFLGFNDTQIGIDYTNVVYTISDTLKVSPDRMGFDRLTLKDSKGNTAKVNATVTHKNFEDMKYTLDMEMDKLMLLNTASRVDSLFYGTVYASGSVKIKGSESGVDINMQLKNDKNSSLNILLPQHSEASDFKSVVYINVPEEKLKDSTKTKLEYVKQRALPVNLKVKLDVNQDLLLGVIIDPATGDALQARGKGTIDFGYDLETENMSTYGDFTFTDGSVKLNLQKIKTLEFKIREGSKLYLNGDPLKSRFDLVAYRRLKADLKTLDSSFEVGDAATKVDVDCELVIKGNLDKMEVAYQINLPNSSEDIRVKVNSYISTDEQRIIQFAYLITAGVFHSNSSTDGGTNFGSSLWTNLASTKLSDGMTSLFGNILGDQWEIGTNIESNDGSFNDVGMVVNVSRKFFDDKLVLKTNLGYHTNASSNDALIGDFDIEYLLNSMWTLKAYSHTNDQFYRQAATTQGVGVVYNREARTLKQLFRSLRPRWRSRTQEQQNLPTDSTKTTVPEQQPIINNERRGDK